MTLIVMLICCSPDGTKIDLDRSDFAPFLPEELGIAKFVTRHGFKVIKNKRFVALLAQLSKMDGLGLLAVGSAARHMGLPINVSG